MHATSADNSVSPVTKKHVRAKMIIYGFYVTEISQSPLKVKFTTVSQMEFGGSIPGFIVNKIGKKMPKVMLEKLIKGIEAGRKK